MAGNKELVYWDACIFLAWLLGEVRVDGEEQAGLEDQIRRFDAGEIIVVTSAITSVEVLDCTLSPSACDCFRRLRHEPQKLHTVMVDHKVCDLAREIRNHYKLTRGPGGAIPSLPDAIHIATAIQAGCKALYTFDRKDKTRNGEKVAGLIPLSGSVAGKYEMLICPPPSPPQLSLPGTATLN